MFIVAEGFIFTTRCGRSSLRIPFKAYYPLVVMFFLVTVCSNYALQLSIPMPLYMVFSSGSLVVNMIMGMVILKTNYNWSKYLAVLLITIGIIVFTVISASDLVRLVGVELFLNNVFSWTCRRLKLYLVLKLKLPQSVRHHSLPYSGGPLVSTKRNFTLLFTNY